MSAPSESKGPGGIHVIPEWGLVEAFAHAVDRAQPTERLVRAIPVVELHDTRPTVPHLPPR